MDWVRWLVGPWALIGWLCIAGCAEGAPDLGSARQEQGFVPSPADAGRPLPSRPDATTAGTSPAPVEMPYTGESCTMGETQPCVCADTGTEGSRSCFFDERSPTQGSLSECGDCAPPPEPEAGTGAMAGSTGMEPEAGGGGMDDTAGTTGGLSASAGMSSAAGQSAGGSMAGGSGGTSGDMSGSGGLSGGAGVSGGAGSGGDGGSGGEPEPQECRESACPSCPLLQVRCCERDGDCGCTLIGLNFVTC